MAACTKNTETLEDAPLNSLISLAIPEFQET